MPRKFTQSQKFFKKVKELIPLASQTFSKSYLQFVKGQAPLFLTHGKGSKVWDLDGNEYIDFVSSLLAVSLGYQYPAVDEAIKKQLKKGISLSLASPLEYELAELLKKHIPSAEMVRFGKNGSDATTGAIRVARAVTGRDYVAVCGYHGWHDWYIGSTTRSLGVPESTRKMTFKFNYNDIGSLEALLKKYPKKFAAVILEPVNYEEPQDNFLQEVAQVTRRHGALLVFDEVITGFRVGLGGAQKYFGVVPDLATFGKSMGNGMPISVLVGKRKYMKVIEDIFYSFTFGGEALSLAASIATIKEMEKKKVIDSVWRKGAHLKSGTNAIIRELGLEEIIHVKGLSFWQVITFTSTSGYSDLELKSFVQQELLQLGFLWYGQHNLSFSHSWEDINKLLHAYKKVFRQFKQLVASHQLREHLRGAPITNIFKVR